MALHPGERKRHLPAELPVAWDPILHVEENEDWYRDLVEHSQDLLCVHDLEGRLLSVNPVPARLLGYTVEEMLRTPMRNLIAPECREQFDVYLSEIERTGEFHGLLAVVTRSGEQRVWECHNTLRTEGVEAPIVRGIAHDVTDRVRAEQSLRENNEQLLKTAGERERMFQELTLFRTLLDQSNDAIEVLDPETMRLLDVNGRACLELGYSREELLSMTVFDIDPLFDKGARAQMVAKLRESGSAIIESAHRRKDGTTFPVEMNLRIVQLDRGYSVAVVRDITERKRAEKLLRENNEQLLKTTREQETLLHELSLFRTLLDQSNDAVQVIDPETLRFLDVNERACVELGYGREELLSMTVLDIDLEVDESLRARVQEQLRKPGFVAMERIHRRKDGTTFPVEVNMRQVHLDRVYNVVVSRDITERKRALEALRESETRFRAVYERSPVGISLVDSRTGQFLQANPKFCEITGRVEEELLRTDADSITHPDDIAVGRERRRQLADAEVAAYELEKRYLRPDGSVRWARISVVPMWRLGEALRWQMALVEDITERRQTEEALRVSEERFRVAIKNSPIAVYQQDRDLRYTWAYNPQVPVPLSEMLGKAPNEFLDPEEAVRLTEVRRRVIETGVGARDEIGLTFAGRKHYYDTTIEPVWNAKGEVIGLTGASMNITELREATEQLREAKRKLSEEKLYLEQEIDTELGFGEIIGQSRSLQLVLENVGRVAASDATVLLLGETGTGKELVARAIHRLSQRANNSFVKLNCAAIPSGLVESELFGDEKGAFTGAVSKKIGRIELADKGTLFLDEIGELPLELQPKLLRVLQDQEFERLGGTHTLKVDFRLIAATNRDLADEVRQNEFRSDLYYRLNVFPIRVPPLRERPEDIRMLIEYFVQKCARRMNKSIMSIPKATMDAMSEWEWPGNVLELENFIERSVILTQGSVLVAPLSELKRTTPPKKSVAQTLEAAEREHILRALRESSGQIGGLRGAAMRLGLKRTTLQSKLKHLGINPRVPPES
jgi:PAS domain S-box-containing protein